MWDRCVLGSSDTGRHRVASTGSGGPRKPLQGNRKRHRMVPQDIGRYGHFAALNPRVRVRVPGGAPVLTRAFFHSEDRPVCFPGLLTATPTATGSAILARQLVVD